ncbi:hypothetical protein ACPPVQ_05560 [Diaminobutyricibacter sp. McL0618]|uniref:hypothetical protein n=1 Tax=Leifsonia sp. McL0618 TaxID=3415677 RepID=UPI003CF1C66B
MNRLAAWVIGVIVATFTLGTVYVVAQQLDRQGADQVGAQLATQVASDLSSGSSATVDALPRVDLAASLAPFVVVYDSSGHPIAGNGYLDGDLAEPPSGVISDAASGGSNHVTWQPRPGLRFATVEVRSGDHVVMGAQSLIPTEDRANRLGLLITFAWLGTMVVLGLAALAFWWVERAQAARGTRLSR